MKEKNEYNIPGFKASAVSAGIKGNDKKDFVLIFSEIPAVAAGVFTANTFKAAPVLIDMERIKNGKAQAVVVNSGNANAATGREGEEDARAISRKVSETLKINDNLVLLASTGVIGKRMPVENIINATDNLIQTLTSAGISAAAEGIMTTDRFPKIEYRTLKIDGKNVTICGIAKGAGMIEPNMATMLAFIMTDVNIDCESLKKLFSIAVDKSFNIISVDGCMSTNDTALILANGCAGNTLLQAETKDGARFTEALSDIMLSLAKAIVRDGEGATKVIRIEIKEAASKSDAKKVAYAIANSNLVKTAFFGGDPNWGRLISAIGSVVLPIDPGSVEVFLEGLPLFAEGKGIETDKEKLSAIMEQTEIEVEARLGAGENSFSLYASDLSYDYVKINALYHT